MNIRVLLTPLKRVSDIYPEELLITGGDATLVGHLRAVANFSTEQMGIDVTEDGKEIVRERGFCIHKACRCCPAITIDCQSRIDWHGAFLQKIGNTHPKERIVEIQPPVSITPDGCRRTLKCSAFQQLKILTKDETLRLVSAIIAATLPYYARPEKAAADKAFGKPWTSAPVEWVGDPRWQTAYETFLFENFA